jgi:hypothetical protein
MEQQHPPQRRRKIECKPQLVIESLQKFYAAHTSIEKIMPYLQGTADLSLRLIDWFVTNYCRKHFIGYPLNGKEFLVYVSYKSQLKAYSKQYFDPNCRRERIMFQIPGSEPFLTTVGKLNFFRWAIETQLLNYIEANYEQIQKERVDSMKTEGSTGSQEASAATAKSTAAAKRRNAGTAETITDGSTPAPAPAKLTAAAFKTTRRRRTKQIPAATRQMQKHDIEVSVSFD